MKLSEFAIENHQFTVMVMALLVLTGAVSFFTMPRSEDPQISPAGSNIVVILPGANPADMEELVLDPIEEVVNELEDIKEIKSTAEDGLALISVEFFSGSDADEKYSDVVQKVNSIRGQLPEEIVKLNIFKWTISDVKILQVALISDSLSYRNLEKEAERLKKRFERVAGVKRADTWAFPQQVVQVAVDLEKLALMRIPLSRVRAVIQSENANIPGGYIDISRRRFNIQTSGSYDTMQDIENTIIDATDSKIVYLKDVAEISLDYKDPTYFARFNGQRAVFVTASQKAGTNIYDVADALKNTLETFRKRLPATLNLEIVFDQSESVAARLNGFFGNLLQGLLLVGGVVLLAVGLRASFIVMLAIPVSIFIGIGLVDLSDFGLEQMSIAGLVIALGLLVDNAIVVTENITRFMKMGYGRKEAAIQGTEQIAWAVISSTVTTVLAFVPIIMMQNITGDFIRSMPATVVYTLAASLLVSLTLTPFLSHKLIVVGCNGDRHESRIRKLLNKFIDTRYRRILQFALRRPKRVLALAGVVFIGSLALFPIVGVSFFPKADKPQLLINIDTPKGTSLHKTDAAARYVEFILRSQPQIKKYAANIGHGNPRIYYNIIPKNESNTHAQILVELHDRRIETLTNTLNTLRKAFADYAGAKIEVKEFEQGPPIEAPIAIRIIGDNLDVLKRISRDVEDMFATVPGVININNPLSTAKTDLQVKINRAKASLLGVPLVEIDRTVRTAVAGSVVSQFRDTDGKEYDIALRAQTADELRVSDFDKIYVSSLTGAQVPLKQLAAIEFKATPMLIDHYNLQRNVLLTADVLRSVSVNSATRQIVAKLQRYDWPSGYRFYIAGEKEQREESFGGMAKAVIVAMIGIFAVLVLQFRSYSQPLVVFSAIPFAITGSILALLITGYSFSFTAFVGITSLVGIVVNNSIILVDYSNQLRRQGKPLLAALDEAARTRFVPIILTTATTVGGLLPLTLRGGTLWAPMGWTIIGGLLVSTVLTLMVVPVLYRLFTPETR